MLNSCASGVSVVNIDNGFGAAYQASMLSSGFSRKFVGRLFLSTFAICFLVVYLFARLLLGG